MRLKELHFSNVVLVYFRLLSYESICDFWVETKACLHFFILALYVFSGVIDGRIWIGATDQQVEGSFRWASLPEVAPVLHTNWAANEPDGGTAENCVIMTSHTGFWRDEPCDMNKISLCEYP